MAKIQTNVSESVFSIKRWRGVNEAEEGETALRNGEGAVCRNFRVTSGGALRKRPGSKTVAGLISGYNVVVGDEEETLFTEVGISDMELSLYPRAEANSVGAAVTAGEAVTVSGVIEAASGEEKYCEAEGRIYKLLRGDVEAAELKYRTSLYATEHNEFLVFDSPPVFHNGQWDDTGGRRVSPSYGNLYHTYLKSDAADGKYLYVTDVDFQESPFWDYEIKCEAYSQPVFSWVFAPVAVEPNTQTDIEVKSLWSGFVAGREVIVAACNGHLWELTLSGGAWSKASCGTMDTTGRVEIFGFDGCAYILTDTEYKVWNGTALRSVEGYVPLVSISNPPAGGGALLEQVNKLTGQRRARFSPDGTSNDYQLPEKNLASIDKVTDLTTGTEITAWTGNTATGVVHFTTRPAAGTNTIEITWTSSESSRSQVVGMKCAELFNGAQDTRVFLYGDGSNKAIYSGLDYDGVGRADYFPDLNEAAVGDANTPIRAMIRHYDRLLCFKADSAWSISYTTITLADGTVTAGFYVSPVNRDVGSCALGEARLVENRPRTLDGRSVIEWKTASGGYLTADQRNAERISQRVESSIRGFDLTTARTFYDKINHEYYVIGSNGDALVNSVDADAWYVYTGFNARCMIVYQDEVYYGDGDGNLRHFSADYFSDNGEAIDCLWESGAMDFSQDYRRKYSAMIWVGIKPEEHGYLEASAETDRKTDFADYEVERDDAGAVPEMTRLKIKAKKFTYYKLIFKNGTADTTATVVSADIRVRSTGYVR